MSPARHTIQRLRHDIRLRSLDVLAVEELTPRMKRITLGGDELEGFVSASPDDHVKLFFPEPGSIVPQMPVIANGIVSVGASKPIARDYTPRTYDASARTLLIDFVLHGDGPASIWAKQSAPGQVLGLGGPRGSFVVPNDFDWLLLVGDETALPSISRRVAELPASMRAVVVLEVSDEAERQHFASAAAIDVHWVHRDGAEPGTADGLVRTVRGLELPAGDGFAWVAAESETARRLRRLLVEDFGIQRDWVKAAGYWKRGDEAVHDEHNG